MARPLGEVQLGCLDALERVGKFPGAWKWDTMSGTRRVLDTLVNRGLVDRLDYGVPRYGRYTINDAGREVLREAERGRG